MFYTKYNITACVPILCLMSISGLYSSSKDSSNKAAREEGQSIESILGPSPLHPAKLICQGGSQPVDTPP